MNKSKYDERITFLTSKKEKDILFDIAERHHMPLSLFIRLHFLPLIEEEEKKLNKQNTSTRKGD